MTGRKEKVAVIGAGFAGLAAAYELVRLGHAPVLIEAEGEVGGLAAGFLTGGTQIERFYHHWYTSDVHIEALAGELGLSEQILHSTTRMGMYFANRIYSLSRPLDLLRLTLLPLADRLRLGWLVLRAKRVTDWRELDGETAADWLRRIGGERAFRVVWEPLLRGKFGRHAEEISAAWIWAKLRLRGSSRGHKGEHLAYFKGGFAALAEEIVKKIVDGGGEVRLRQPASGLVMENGRPRAIMAGGESIPVTAAIFTPAPSLSAAILAPLLSPDEHRRLSAIDYLANICIVLELSRSLSDLYWMNVNDPSFPFVGIIEHTRLDQADPSGRRHIVYLSRYLPADDQAFAMQDGDVVAQALPYLRQMFPDFRDELVTASHVWRARHAQPLVVRGYGELIPEHTTSIPGVYLASMAQVYPEDRGTNYAIRDGRKVARMVDAWLQERR